MNNNNVELSTLQNVLSTVQHTAEQQSTQQKQTDFTNASAKTATRSVTLDTGQRARNNRRKPAFGFA